MSTFTVTHQDKAIEVVQDGKDRFTVALPGKTLELLLKQDNEGANHWFEAGTDEETEESKSIGIAIETYLIEQG